MKVLRIIATLVLLKSISNICFSQYDSMVVESKLWAEIEYFYNWGGGLSHIFTTHYKFERDTSIGGKKYKILYYNYRDPLLNNWAIRSYFREDSMRVYEYFIDEEYLRYDFSLQKGDTICCGDPIDNCYCYYIAESVDTISVIGKLRKRISFGEYVDIWIEGIGSIYEPFNPFSELVDEFDLLCCQQYDNIIYQHPWYNDCFVEYISDIKSITLDRNKEIFINPNPLIDNTEITVGGIDPGGYDILYLINQLGQIIKEYRLFNNMIKIERDNLSSGFYLVLFIDNNGSIITERMIVK
jgi:hypothetical protein